MDVFFYIAAVFAILATWALLTSLGGILGGAPYVYGENGHAQHQHHFMVMAVQGAAFLTILLDIWEIIRGIAAWIGYGEANSFVTWGAIIVGFIFLFFAWRAKGGH